MLPHEHRERECAACSLSLRHYIDVPLVSLHDGLDYGQSQSNAIVVNLGRTVHLSETCEEAWDVIWVHSRARVRYAHTEHVLSVLVICNDFDQASLRGLERVLYQVGQDLLQAPTVTHEPREVHPLRTS